MKNTIFAIAAIAGLLFANTSVAQDKKEEKKEEPKHKTTLTISNRGIYFSSADSANGLKAGKVKKERTEGIFSSNFAMIDLGFNQLIDNTNYSDPAVKTFLDVPANMQNKSVFTLHTAKSINVNIYPWMIKFRALKTEGQRIYLSSGIGFQFYNFRFENPVTYAKNPARVTMDTIVFTKDKLAMNYLNIPLMLTFKTRVHRDDSGKSSKDKWLVYGFGVTEGMRIDSWSKQKSGARGKVKVHDAFGLADFNTCVSAEIGLEGFIRFYATYQVTSLYSNGIDQHPVSFGIRLGGI